MNNYNFVTGLLYGGGNQVALETTRQAKGYKEEAWLTFVQAKGAGYKVKKGEHGVGIFCGFIEVDEKQSDGKIKMVSRPGKFARVFNIEQCEKVIGDNQ